MTAYPVSGAILAGGQSSRMGRNKAFVKVGGRAIIQWVIELLGLLVDELVIIANDVETYEPLGLPVYPDILPGNATLGGLYTAVKRTEHDYTLVVSCDQPFLNRELLAYLLELRDGFDVVVPLNQEGYPQSMHAVYGQRCAEPIRERIEAGRLKVIGFFPDVRVREVTAEEIDRYDPHRYSFVNVNRPEDLETAQQLASQIDDL